MIYATSKPVPSNFPHDSLCSFSLVMCWMHVEGLVGDSEAPEGLQGSGDIWALDQMAPGLLSHLD